MAEPVRLLCPQCRTAYRLKVAVRPGARVTCSKCGAAMVVPEPPSAPPVAGTSALAGSSDDRQVSLSPDQAAPTMTLPDGGSEEDVQMVLKDAAEAPGRYIEQVVIGRGGMGEVVLCVDRNIRRQVALKRILPHAANDPSRRARFVEEAQVTGQLEHPNIVPVHELERTPDGTIYFTMKLVRGRSLADILREMREESVGKPGSPPAGSESRPDFPPAGSESRPDFPPAGSNARGRVRQGAAGPDERRQGAVHYHPAGIGARGMEVVASVSQKSLEGGVGGTVSSERFPPSLSLSELLQIFLKVCDGVAYAHSRGVIHRDLKPANIMVGDFGEVLVMDWGLARILATDDRGTVGLSDRGLVPTPEGKTRLDEPAVPHREGDIVSDRQELADMRTLDGSAIGTPAYMAPEQAEGKLDKIDERSDIYSLGAILYEILTLERAIQGENQWQVLANVLNGRIVPPEKRAPNRQPPRELSAIAMKCLSKNRARRYRSVMDLRKDISLFLEGRSVSARPDTFGQAVVKLVKRNKGVSAAAGAAAVVLLAVGIFSYGRIARERNIAVGQRAAAQASERKAVASDQQRQATALAASRRQAESAVRAASEGRLDEASVRAQAAVEVMPDGPWGHYALGVVASERKDYPAARRHLDAGLRLDPAHAPSKLLHASVLAMTGDLAKWETLVAEADRSTDWKALVAAGDALFSAERYAASAKAFQQALALMQKEAAISTSTIAEVRDKAGRSHACVTSEALKQALRRLPTEDQARRLEAYLRDLYKTPGNVSVQIEKGRIKAIDLYGGGDKVRWLDPLRGLQIEELNCSYTAVSQLGPLRGVPLKSLVCANTPVSDLSPLKGMALTTLSCAGTRVSDFGPLKGMPLSILHCSGTQVSNLGPLEGMPLTNLDCSGTGVRDLGPLKGMPLTELGCGATRVADLGPLKGMRLRSLDCDGTLVSDLGALQGMPLERLQVTKTAVADLGPLKGMPLRVLCIGSCEGVRDLGPLKGLPLTKLHVEGTGVTDLTPLDGMRIHELALSPQRITRGLDVARGMKTIQAMSTGGAWMGPAEFWRKHDAGEFGK